MMHGGLQAMANLPQEKATETWAVLRRLLAYLKPFRVQLGYILVLVIISATAQALGPYLIGQAIDGAISNGDLGQLNRDMLLLFTSYIVLVIANRSQFIAIGSVGQRTLASMRSQIFSTIQKLSLRFFDRQPAGDLMSRLSNDTDVLNQLFSQGLIQIIGSLFGLSGIIIAMLLLDWRLALASFVIIPLMLLMTNVFARMSRRAFRRARESLGEVSSDIQEEIAGVKVAQAFNRTDLNVQQFEQRNAANRDANVTATAVTSAFTPAIDILSTVATVIVAGYGGYLAIQGQATVGVVIAFLTYVQQFFRPIQAIASFYTTAQASLAAAERIFELIDTPLDLTDAPDAIEMPAIKGEVRFEHVWFSYGERPSSSQSEKSAADWREQAELKDISLLAEPGQTIAIVGPTGAGKTTLVNLIGRFYDVNEGQVLIDGIDLRKVTRASLRSQMGIVLQDSFLFAGTIMENLRYGRLDASDEEVEAAAKAAHAHDFIMRLPKGYQTEIGERGGTLSQGQRQLLGIARAILADPRILILDEATSSIDTRSEVLIQKALKTLLRGRTSFVIAHRLSTIRDADQVLVMQQGRIVECGTHNELLEQAGLYADLYQRQFRKYKE